MPRCTIAILLSLVTAAPAAAHFPFILPDSDGTSARLVFSDSLSPDTSVSLDAIAHSKLMLRKGEEKQNLTPSKKEDGFITLKLPGSGPRVIYGVTDYGVLQVGDTRPFKLVYFPKALIGTTVTKEATLGDQCPLEVVPVSVFGKLKFQVLSQGKPLADAEVTVLPPEGKKKALKTDKDGLTSEFTAHGRYGVTAKHVLNKSGDFAGKKYDEVRNYATLVLDFTK